MREIEPGQPLPIGGVCKRTATLPSAKTRQIIVRLPLWLSYRTAWNVHDDEMLTAWWVRVVQLTFERAVSLPILSFRISWGDLPILQHEKVHEPALMHDDCA